ncbi:MAG: efflux RND transporter permease subunit, partial [Pseudomonadota bacterium]
GRFTNTVGRLYWRSLSVVFAAPMVVIFAACMIAGGAYYLYDDLGEELVPTEDRGGINIWMQGPDGVGLDHTDRQVVQVEEMLRPWVEQGAAESIYSITGRYDLNRGQVQARLAPWSERTVSQADIEADLRPKLAQLPGAQARIFGGNSLGLRRAGSGVELALTGSTYPEIADAAFDFAQRLETIEGLSDPRVQYQATQPQLSLRIDRSRITDLGVDMDDLASTLRALVDEEELTELTIGDEAVPIMLQSKPGSVRDPADLLNLSTRTTDGTLVRLSQIVSLSEGGVAAELDRHGQRRAIEIDISRDPGLTLREAVDQIRLLAGSELPDDVGLLFLGEAATLEESSSELTFTFAIALVVVFLVLLAQFESLTSAVVVMLIVPFGLASAVYALWFTGVTLNVYSQIGVLLLIGIMAKNSILMVEFADQLRDNGMDVWNAAHKGAHARFRPIMMTLVSTMLAALPLIVSTGPGSEAREAIGWVIFGGLGFAVVFTLFLTPCTYALVAGLSKPRAASGKALEKELGAMAPGE